ncbi:MAG: membrane protein insertase YidC [candidate division Zixibacteria bacterium]|nr:membrane protein insertase YidC [candidate division Zixibacteria bacterium]NIR62298.1 membrane protein insertase YidC [candidate division Zixibacteria bacterium]NIS15759.1 membrane protein insertase YidC [candidate division Zixibacteria bacterium]NIS48503.1 membrane protein insertase YidC [candidate division Zixibacteria bacterium]NIT52240.1 membrane protein insertase YidC [candidate division Zixibacteria bacterium]
MDRTTVIALIIIGLMFVAWFFWMSQQTPQPQPQTPVEQDTLAVREATGEEAQAYEDQTDTATAEILEPLEEDSLFARFDTLRVDTVRVETDKYIAQFTTRGASLVSFKFKNYNYNNGDTTMIDMVPPWTRAALKFQFPDARDSFYFDRIIFIPSKNNIRISGGNKDKLDFTANLGNQGSITVEYEFYADRYDFSTRLDFQNAAAFDLGRYYYFGWEPGLESTEKNRQDDFNSFKAYIMWDTGLEDYNKFQNGQMSQEIEGNLQWIATKTKYFFVGIVPDRAPEGVRIQGREISVNEKAGQPGMKKIGVQAEMEIHQRKSDLFDRYMIYVGPIDYSILKSYNRGFEDTVDLGWPIISSISLFILWLMQVLYGVFHNYGVVIIIFSILMKVIFYPLTSRSLKSMKKMQELQPKLKALQEKYKKEPQKMQSEIMKLWKENKVNPMSGCLLMLPQLPIFFALFTVFRNTILLRGSEFVFWMNDLSQPDQTMILPIIMAGTMFLQQKMTMQDPKQKMLVYILPIVFFFLFKGFPTGLVLYWTMFNILSVLETLLIRKPQQQRELALKTE